MDLILIYLTLKKYVKPLKRDRFSPFCLSLTFILNEKEPLILLFC